MDVPPIVPVQSSSGTTPTDRHQQRSGNPPQSKGSDDPESKSRFEAVSEDGNEIVYRAVDPETGIVLAEVPSEEVRRVAQRLRQLIAEGKIS